MTDELVALRIDGVEYRGWTDVSVTRSLTQLSGAFRLGLSTAWLEDGQLQSVPLKAGMACQLRMDDQPVIQGYIDAVGEEIDDAQHSLSVDGRDAAGDLLDCSAQVREYRNQSLLAIARDLCKPYGVDVQLANASEGGAFPLFAVDPGDSVGQCIERLCRQHGLLAWSTGQGGLRIGRTVTTAPVAELTLGQNLLALSRSQNWSERFSHYQVLSSREGTDDLTGEDISTPSGRAVDRLITRHRPVVLLAEATSAGPSLNERAAWEARVRAARSVSFTATVQGWSHDHGLWQPGDTVRITGQNESPAWLIGEVTYSLDESRGTRTSLTLYPPAAFDVLAEPETKESWA